MWVCAWVSSGGPIAVLSPSRGPARRLRKVLCSCQRGRCSLLSVSCLREWCRGRAQRLGLGSGRTERLLGPCCPEPQSRPAADPCTCERRCGNERQRYTGAVCGGARLEVKSASSLHLWLNTYPQARSQLKPQTHTSVACFIEPGCRAADLWESHLGAGWPGNGAPAGSCSMGTV